jgi:hypothetical protein
MRRIAVVVVVLSLTSSVQAAAQHERHQTGQQHDSAFRALQERGKAVMGVDQYTSSHVFDALADGGRIELQRDVDDSVGVRVIRAHLQDVAKRFAAGDFSLSQAVHGTADIPGVAAMRAAGSAIRYTYRELPRGGEVRLTTSDARARAAIHAFVRFQRSDHRSGQP